MTGGLWRYEKEARKNNKSDVGGRAMAQENARDHRHSNTNIYAAGVERVL